MARCLNKTESWEEKEVREKCWRAVTSLGGNFPEMYILSNSKASCKSTDTCKRTRKEYSEGIVQNFVKESKHFFSMLLYTEIKNEKNQLNKQK